MLRRIAHSPATQLALIGLGTAVAPLDTAVNIAFPAIAEGFGLKVGDLQWVVISYVLTYAALMLGLGRIGDMFGHALVFRLGLAWSAVALLLCGFATSFAALLAFRVLQGIGAALVLSCGPALATSLYGEERRSRVLGIYTMALAIGSAIGPLIGGVLVQSWGWPAVFAFRVPIAALVPILIGALPTQAAAPRESFDLTGAALLALALAGMLLAINRIPDLTALPLGLIAAAAIAGFVRHERRCKAPIIDMQVFRLGGFAAVNVANVLTNLAGFAVWLLVPFYLVRATGLTLAEGGMVLATAWMGATVSSLLAGRLIGPVRAQRIALAGALINGLGLWLVSSWQAGTPAALMMTSLIVQGFGLGLFQVAYTDIVTAAIPRENRGVAGSLTMVTRTVGIVGAASVVMLVFQSFAATAGFLGGFQTTFSIAAALSVAVAGLMAWRLAR